MDPSTMQALIEAVQKAYESGGWFGLVALIVPAVVELYKKQKTQDFFDELDVDWLCWDNLKKPVKVGIVGGTSFVGSLFAALALGLSWPVALAATVPVAAVAVVTHIFGKAAGSALDDYLKKRNPQYVPGTLRKATSVLVPLKKEPRVIK